MMSIPSDTLCFPNNVVDLVAARSQLLDSDLFVIRRPLRDSDPNESIGVFGVQWTPEEDSYEMRGAPSGASEPTLQRYLITVQGFVKDMDEEAGLARHSVLSKMIRSMLYRDEPLRVGLATLSPVQMNGSTESLKRWGVRQVRYFSNELNSVWLYLSNLEFWLETETI